MDPQNGTRPGAPAPGKGGGVGGWVKRNKGPAAAIGAVGLVAVITIAKRGQSSSSSSGTGTASSGTTSQTGVQPGVYGYTGDAGYSSGYDQYAGQMAGLQDLLNSYTAGTLGAQLFPNGLPQSAPAPAPKTSGYTVSPKPPIITSGRIQPAQTITVPKGASLLSLSQRYLGTSNRTELAHANGLGTGAGLRTGQRLIIPAH